VTISPNYLDQLLQTISQALTGFMPDMFEGQELPGTWFGRPQSGVGEWDWSTYSQQTQTEEPVAVFKEGRWMSQYHNGYIPLNVMTEIPGGGYLRPDAAAAYMDMYRAAAADGVTITVGAGGAAYRTFQQQVDLAEDKGLYSEGGLAAVPGTSLHGWGIAIDAGEGRQRQWLAQNANKYGFSTISREPWHWQYDGSYWSPETPQAAGQKQKPQRATGGEVTSTDPRAAQASLATLRMTNPNILFNAMFGLLQDEASSRHGGMPAQLAKDETPQGGVKRQLWQGFMDAGRADLAKMVFTKDFQAWIQAESGWNVDSVSKTYVVNGISGVNGGLFQIRYPAHPWAQQYFSSGNSPSGNFTASAYEQAMLIAKHFPGLTAEKIREYARQVRSGGYHGWP